MDTMQNGEVQEIVRLEGQAAQTEKASSADRWRAAQLIASQLAHKTYRQLSQDIKAAGGKGSIGHLERMNRCWKIIGQQNYDVIKDDFAAYPNFTNVYQSDEVGRAGEKKKDDGEQRQGRDPEDMTTSELVTTMNAIAGKLVGSRRHRRQLSQEDAPLLQDTQRKISVLIRDITG